MPRKKSVAEIAEQATADPGKIKIDPKEKLREIIKALQKNPLIIGGIAALALAIVFFTPAFLAIGGALLLLALLLGLGLLYVKIKYKTSSLKEVMVQKKVVLREISLLEKQYMKRQLSKKDFIEIFREKQTRLIELEAQIDEKFNKETFPEKIEDPQIKELAAKKRHIVNELLSGKRRLLKEMDITQKLYLKRKIDGPTYQKLIRDRKQKLIELEAQVKEIYGEEDVNHVMGELKERLSSVESQRKKASKKKKKISEDEEFEIASEIVEQLRDFE